MVRVLIGAGFESFDYADLYPSAWAMNVRPLIGAGGYSVLGLDGQAWQVLGNISSTGPWPAGGGTGYRIMITGLNLTQPDAGGALRTVSVTGLNVTLQFGVSNAGFMAPFNLGTLLSYWDTAHFDLRLNSLGNTVVGPSGNIGIPSGGNHNIAALSGRDTVRGGLGDDVVSGGDGADNLLGMGGADTLYGGRGDDSLQGGDGADTLYGDQSLPAGRLTNGKDTLRGGDGNDRLHGDGGNDRLYGDAGDDTLDGGAGADLMAGGTGDDTYEVDSTTDRVIELAGEGHDTVNARVSVNLSGQAVEVIQLTGSAAINAIGNGLDNVIYGNSAANVLDGRAGADTMHGGGGNDSYHVDNAGDVIFHSGPGGEVFATSSYTLPTGSVVGLRLLGSAAIDGTGNSLANRITGNGAANRLDGGAGADSLYGGAGDDTYIADDAGDRVFELEGGGFDIIYSSVSYGLPAKVEALILTGTAPITATGDAFDNHLIGNGGSNDLRGGAGADTLDGGLWSDVLVGGAGADVFAFTSALGGGTNVLNGYNVDRILDFTPGEDLMALSTDIFVGLPSDLMDEAAFHIGATATTAQHRIIYNKTEGKIFFDPDGVGSQRAYLFFTVSPNLELKTTDFLLY